MDGVAKGNQRTKEVKGEKGRDSEPEKAHCLSGAANCMVGGKPTQRVRVIRKVG